MGPLAPRLHPFPTPHHLSTGRAGFSHRIHCRRRARGEWPRFLRVIGISLVLCRGAPVCMCVCVCTPVCLSACVHVRVLVCCWGELKVMPFITHAENTSPRHFMSGYPRDFLYILSAAKIQVILAIRASCDSSPAKSQTFQG